jgi:hypothetical protein
MSKFDRPEVPACAVSPARPTGISPQFDDVELAAIAELVGEGILRDQAEELVKTHGTNRETLRALAWLKEAADGRTD